MVIFGGSLTDLPEFAHDHPMLAEDPINRLANESLILPTDETLAGSVTWYDGLRLGRFPPVPLQLQTFPFDCTRIPCTVMVLPNLWQVPGFTEDERVQKD